jgi:hypothetical protein
VGAEYAVVVAIVAGASLFAFMAALVFGLIVFLKTGDPKSLRDAGAFVQSFRGAVVIAVAEVVSRALAAVATRHRRRRGLPTSGSGACQSSSRPAMTLDSS